MMEFEVNSILVVDDSPTNVRFLTDVLSGKGHLVHTATDGRQAMRSARSLHPDLILLDIVMPDLDGFQVCRILKSSKETRDIPVIFMTSLTETRDKVRGFELGAADYITKPFQVEEVLARVETLLALNALRKRLESRNAELQHYQEHLEHLVSERTAELEEANSNLHREIAERRLVEERLKNSLAEKEVLLKEVHHRVKNNLQIVSTLLELQCETVRDEQAVHSFRESQDRIRAMGMIHEKLYQSRDLASIDFGDYIRNLAGFLFSSYVQFPERIGLRIGVESISLVIDDAIPCGLIINELVSNSLKHAFPDGREGTVAVNCRLDDDGVVSLEVADTGVGLPPDLDPLTTGSLGLQIVSILVGQLHGTMEVKRNGGTLFVIRFRASRCVRGPVIVSQVTTQG